MSLLAAGGALAQPPLLQLPGTAGCVSDTGTGGACADGLALAGAHAVALSPDGRHVYVTASTDDAIAVFDRDQQTRTLTQKAGTGACISQTGSGGSCVEGYALDSPEEVAVSPDGNDVVVVSSVSSSITTFQRNLDTGALTQTDFCVAQTGFFPCADGKGPQRRRRVRAEPGRPQHLRGIFRQQRRGGDQTRSPWRYFPGGGFVGLHQ